MSLKPKRNRSTGLYTTPSQAAETAEATAGKAARDENIRRRAYELCLERGGQPGRELEDWLKAERALET
jgi:hypothetical protein